MKIVEKIKEYQEHIIQFIKFNLVGVINTGVDIGIYAVLFHVGVYYLVANVISYSCGVINSYLWNKFWTFKKKSAFSGAEILKFIVVNIVSLGVATLFIYIFHEKVGLSEMISKIFATGFSLIVNFGGNKFWVFKDEKPVEKKEKQESNSSK